MARNFKELQAKMSSERQARNESASQKMDERLFSQILATAATLDEDVRLGKLHSFEEVFGED